MKTLKYCLPVIMLLALASCEKEPTADNTRGSASLKTSSDPWSAAANPQNPYESLKLGQYHNEAVNYFRDQRDAYSTQEAWINDSYKIVIDFFCSGSDVTYCDPSITPAILEAIADTALTDSLAAVNLSSLPTEVRSRLNELWGLFEVHSPGNYGYFKDDIITLEAEIASDAQLNDEYKKMLLCATQVARYSGLYWKQAMDNNFANWEGVSINMDDAEWSTISRLDVRGSAVGYNNGSFSSKSVKRSAKGGPIASLSRNVQNMY